MRRDADDDEQRDPFKRGFVKLARVTRHLKRVRRKHHRPRAVPRAAVQFGVDEVREPAKEKSNWRAAGEEIAHRKRRQFVLAREEKARKRHADEAAVKRHAAFPQHQRRRDWQPSDSGFDEARRHVRAKRLPWLDQQVGFVEEEITEAPARYDADRDPEDHVVELRAGEGRRARGPELRILDKARQVEPARREPANIGEGIPANRQGAEMDGDGIDIRVRQAHSGCARTGWAGRGRPRPGLTRFFAAVAFSAPRFYKFGCGE